jgi:hypothetical protein
MPSVEGSKRFLASYLDSLLTLKQTPDADPVKGKSVLSYEQGFKCKAKSSDGRKQTKVQWTPPPEGKAKLNTDGSFVCTNEAGAGMILRDHKGAVLCAASRPITHCIDATDAELSATEEGIALALN